MASNSIHVVLLDGDPTRQSPIEATLKAGDAGRLAVSHATSCFDALDRARREPIDAFLLDLSTCGAIGLDLLARLRESVPTARVVVVTATGDDAVGEKAVHNGAVGFMPETAVSAKSIEKLLAADTYSAATQAAPVDPAAQHPPVDQPPAPPPPAAPAQEAGSRRVKKKDAPPPAEPPATAGAPPAVAKTGSAFSQPTPDELLDQQIAIRVLVIEDNPGDVFLIKQALEASREERFELETANRLGEGLRLLGEREYDVILLDLILPDSSGLRTFFKVRNAAKGTAVIAMASLDDRDLGTSILHEGAQDFLLKGSIDSDQLTRSIRYSRERNRVEREIKEAREIAVKASRAKSDFLASMSHEIRTPMNSILGMAELLLESKLDPEQRRYVQTLSNAGEALLALINDVLDLSKIEADKVELEIGFFNLYELVEKTTTLHAAKAQEKGLILVCDIASEVPRYVGGDQNRVRQVLINLLGNAIKFTDRGEVLLRVERRPSTPDVVQLRFSVADTGVGIPPDRVRMIFDAFSQADSSVSRKYGGTGLGLAISRRLARLMGGDLSCDSVLNEGSTFYFTATFKPPEAQTAVEHLPPEINELPILVLMENPTERGVVKEILTSWGCRVTASEREEPAIDELWRAQSSGRPYQLMFLDAHMQGASGFDIAAGIRGEPELTATPILLLNSIDGKSEASRCEELGVDYLIKPVLQSDLLRTLDKVLGHERVEESAASASAGGQPLPAIRILLVDDSEDNRLLILSFFKKTPFQISVAEDGQKALDKLYSRKYDLVLMDMQMPIMDGYTATRELRKWEKEKGVRPTAVIALTAQAFQEDEQRCLEAGCDCYLVKPIRKQKLLQAILEQTAGVTTDDPARKPLEPVEAFVSPHEAPPPPTVAAAPAAHEVEEHVDQSKGIQALVPGYLRNRRRDIDTIRAALRKSDLQSIQRLGHNMKGTGKGYGFPPLSEIGRCIERAAIEGDAQSLQQLVKDLEAFLDRVEGVEHTEQATRPPATGKKVVIVDDDRDYLNLMKVTLSAQGFQVEGALDGQSAIKTIRELQPDVVLLDIGLPAGNGFKVIERLKALAPTSHIPIITVSGRDPDANRDRALKAGAVSYLQKPVELEELVAEIERQV